jgi:hypothetical protein
LYPIFIGSWICIHNYPGVSGYSAVFMSRIKISTTTLWYQLYSGLSKLLRILSLRLLFKFRFKIENLLEYWVWGFLLSEFKFEIKTLKRVETVCRASSCYSTRLSLDIVFFCTSNLSFWNFELFLRVLYVPFSSESAAEVYPQASVDFHLTYKLLSFKISLQKKERFSSPIEFKHVATF